jgi:hypothetical protein
MKDCTAWWPEYLQHMTSIRTQNQAFCWRLLYSAMQQYCNLEQNLQHFRGMSVPPLTMETAGSSIAVLVSSCQTTCRHIPEDSFHSHCCENLQSHKPSVTQYDDDIQTVKKKRHGNFMSEQKDVLCPTTAC